VTVTTLAAFDPTSVDMLTIVLIGSSTSRAFTRGDGRTMAYTPRGYAAKSSGAIETGEGPSAADAGP
jgi:cobalt-precorrin 5A hydrolase/precorrin-3B C17-methyltransferase